jgi:hypothetical protein
LLAHREIFLQRKTRSLSGHGGHRASLTPFNLAEATDGLPFALPSLYGERLPGLATPCQDR